jgi:site-specific recombinase XerD
MENEVCSGVRNSSFKFASSSVFNLMSLLQLESIADAAAIVVQPATSPSTNPYLVYMASLSAGSRRAAGQALRVVADILQLGVGPEDVPWHLLRHEHTAAVRARLLDLTYAPGTANRILTALRGVLQVAFSLGQMNGEELARAKGVKSVRGSREPRGRALAPEEVQRLFDACGDPETVAGARNAAVLGLLFGAGLRRSEIVALDLSNYDGSAEVLRVVGKGNKERIVHVTNGSRRALAAWLRHRGDQPGPLFFPVDRVGRIAPRRMTDQAVFDLVRRLASKAGVAAMSPHDGRRSFISSLLDLGADLAVVQSLAGHQSPATTSKYDRRGERARRRAIEMLHVPFEG